MVEQSDGLNAVTCWLFSPSPQPLCLLPTCLMFLYKSGRKIGSPHGGVNSNVFHNGNEV